jgi:predicted amidohydrolase YtcJ
VRPGDRIEHASLVPAELLAELAASGLRVVTQPGFLADRGDDYLADVPVSDHADLYRCRSLLDAGVPVALSSDAPYGPVDPWAVVAAAVHRRTRSGAVAGAAERLPFDAALDAYLSRPGDPGGSPRRVVPGLSADLVLLDRPLVDLAAEPDAGAVRNVLVDGAVVIDR